ncbi:FMN-binding protein [Sporichthya polymorpha]|uniref:FMN-binding protein n=1 Tax=Sporichthya polymorpha TaxID=35751 RepID=UPI00036DA5E9|nr:FMN-binding protein [Sporichthya polymorpha]
MSAPRWAARRNALFAAGTGAVLVALLMYPSSTSGSATQASASGEGSRTATVKPGADGLLIVDGPVVNTDYGPVQVQIKFREELIENATALLYPRATLVDKAINDDAVDTLIGQTLIEQNAQFDTISGATHTSEAYRISLQAALDAAHAAPSQAEMPAEMPAGMDHGGGSG